MRICDLNTGLGQLTHAHSDLRDRLLAIKANWNDQALRQFEQTHFQDIPAKLQHLLSAVQQFAEVVQQAERDCGDHSDSY